MESKLTPYATAGLVIVYIILLVYSLYRDYEAQLKNNSSNDESYTKKMLIASRDLAIKGAIVGMLTLPADETLHSIILWFFVGGITNNMSNIIGNDTNLN